LGLVISNFPYLVPPSLTVWDTAAAPASQIFMLLGTLLLLPIILCYVAFIYWLFPGQVRPGQSYHYLLWPLQRPSHADHRQHTLLRPWERARHFGYHFRKLSLQRLGSGATIVGSRPNQNAALCAHVSQSRPGAPLRRPGKIEVRSTRRGERDEWRNSRITAQIG